MPPGTGTGLRSPSLRLLALRRLRPPSLERAGVGPVEVHCVELELQIPIPPLGHLFAHDFQVIAVRVKAVDLTGPAEYRIREEFLGHRPLDRFLGHRPLDRVHARGHHLRCQGVPQDLVVPRRSPAQASRLELPLVANRVRVPSHPFRQLLKALLAQAVAFPFRFVGVERGRLAVRPDEQVDFHVTILAVGDPLVIRAVLVGHRAVRIPHPLLLRPHDLLGRTLLLPFRGVLPVRDVLHVVQEEPAPRIAPPSRLVRLEDDVEALVVVADDGHLLLRQSRRELLRRGGARVLRELPGVASHGCARRPAAGKEQQQERALARAQHLCCAGHCPGGTPEPELEGRAA
mmetsp:Transcript_94248/g.218951  ORF Transcript_94248/g.218951 Transcript_94248/m.218951 type:complete len:345 (+) Transcript_94248:29-1063(+)